MLQKRAALLQRLRAFFAEHGFLEVETPLLSSEIIPETHIDPPKTAASSDNAGLVLQAAEARAITPLWLQASPEAHMKRLLSTIADSGLKAIYQITRSFRQAEIGPHHNPEFTIVEWYRTGDDMLAGIHFLDSLCQRMLDAPPAVLTSYEEAFERNANINPFTATIAELQKAAREQNITLGETEIWTRDDWLHVLLSRVVEPALGQEAPEIIYHYPASQAALANIVHPEKGKPVAERFELYWRGIELANGYHELTDANELRSRFENVNAERSLEEKTALPMPERLLSAMKAGLPPCSGVALGFDRLVMLATGAKSLSEVLAFPVDRA